MLRKNHESRAFNRGFRFLALPLERSGNILALDCIRSPDRSSVELSGVFRELEKTQTTETSFNKLHVVYFVRHRSVRSPRKAEMPIARCVCDTTSLSLLCFVGHRHSFARSTALPSSRRLSNNNNLLLSGTCRTAKPPARPARRLRSRAVTTCVRSAVRTGDVAAPRRRAI